MAVAGHIETAVAQDGKTLYKKCGGCHTIGKGDKKGPDLAGISNKRSQDWLIKFIQSSKTMIAKGDPEAVAVYEDYKKSPMKDFKLTDEECKAILAYIDAESGGGEEGVATAGEAAPAAETASATEEASGPEVEALKRKLDSLLEANTKESIQKGKDLFTGKTRFENNGIACFACHSLTDRENINGGLLSVDLTKTFSKSGGHDGLNSLIAEPPSPSMEVAYKSHLVTPEEAVLLQLYLQDVEKNNPEEKPADGWILPVSSSYVLGALVLFILAVWFRRKKRSVNYAIIKRQEQKSK